MSTHPDEEPPQKPPEILDKIADVVLKYRPKDKQPKAKKPRKRKKASDANSAMEAI